MDRGGIDLGGDVHEAEVHGASWKPQPAHVPHQRNIRVVDCDREVFLVRQRRTLGVLSGSAAGREQHCQGERKNGAATSLSSRH